MWSNGGMRTLLMLAPVIAVVGLPIAAYLSISLLPEAQIPSDSVLALLPDPNRGSKQLWMEAFSKLLCPLFYLCVPILCGVTTAASSFAREKEDHTLETVFLSALDSRSIYNAKVTGCCILSLLISWISFAALTITLSVLGLLLSAPFFLNLEWIIVSLLITPALVFFSVSFVSLILHRVQRVQETLLTCGYLILPLAVLYVLQFSGVFYCGPFLLLVFFLLIAAFGVVLFNRSGIQFNAETLFTRETLDRETRV